MTVFVSHARDDAAMARRLADELAAAGVRCVIDPELPAGDPFWRSALLRVYRGTRLLVELDSAAAAASPWVEQERRAWTGARVRIAVDGGAGPVARAAPVADTTDAPIVTIAKSMAPRDAVRSVAAAWRVAPAAPGTDPLPAPRAAVDPGAVATRRARLLAASRSRLDDWVAALARRSPRRFERDGERLRSLDDGAVYRRVGDGDAARWLAVAPVDNRRWRDFVDDSGWPPLPTWDRGEHAAADAPACGMDWFEAAACAAWLGGELPSERTWLAAAAAGGDGASYATADGGIGADRACYGQPFGASAPEPAASRPPSRGGFAGLAGNSWDWCSDAWGAHRVIRGGGCMDSAGFCAVGARYRNAPVDRDCSVGVRVALHPQSVGSRP